jgi:feruloyl-CoA synthase
MDTITASPLTQVPFKPIDFLTRDIELERRGDGSMILRSRHTLRPWERHIPAFLDKWARETPERTWLAQRRGAERQWTKLSYGDAKRAVDSVTQALLDRGFGPDRPVMILSGNSLEFAILMMAGMQARAPVAPVSPAYSLMSRDHEKLRYVFELIRPGMIFVQNGEPFSAALAALDLDGVALVHVDAPPPGLQSVPWSTLVATEPTGAVAQSIAAIDGRTIGKFLFTSGSTGMPKAVINTQEMMCANVAMGQMASTRKPDAPAPVKLEWLPWNHTMGGNATLHGTLADGGTTYLDDGKPLPGLFDETIRNLREVSPTSFANVPAGFAALVVALEKDEALAKSFFKDLSSLAYGGATLPDDIYHRMQALAVRYTGYRIPFTTGWGSTETAPTATVVHWASERVGLIGLPFPGVALKMVPTGDGKRYELRVKSVIVTPGYWKQPHLTAAAFDEEGFYKIGDAGYFVDPEDPSQGLVFAGRVVEDFKLMSGTFVNVGSLRVDVVAAASPVLQDCVVTGHDRAWVGILGFPNVIACRALVGDKGGTLSAAELVRDPRVVAHLRQGLAAFNRDSGGSSRRIERAMLMAEPPQIDGSEITDKGYINQRAVLERRKALVEQLYADALGDDVIVIGR